MLASIQRKKISIPCQKRLASWIVLFSFKIHVKENNIAYLDKFSTYCNPPTPCRLKTNNAESANIIPFIDSITYTNKKDPFQVQNINLDDFLRTQMAYGHKNTSTHAFCKSTHLILNSKLVGITKHVQIGCQPTATSSLTQTQNNNTESSNIRSDIGYKYKLLIEKTGFFFPKKEPNSMHIFQ